MIKTKKFAKATKARKLSSKEKFKLKCCVTTTISWITTIATSMKNNKWTTQKVAAFCVCKQSVLASEAPRNVTTAPQGVWVTYNYLGVEHHYSTVGAGVVWVTYCDKCSHRATTNINLCTDVYTGIHMYIHIYVNTYMQTYVRMYLQITICVL